MRLGIRAGKIVFGNDDPSILPARARQSFQFEIKLRFRFQIDRIQILSELIVSRAGLFPAR